MGGVNAYQMQFEASMLDILLDIIGKCCLLDRRRFMSRLFAESVISSIIPTWA